MFFSLIDIWNIINLKKYFLNKILTDSFPKQWTKEEIPKSWKWRPKNNAHVYNYINKFEQIGQKVNRKIKNTDAQSCLIVGEPIKYDHKCYVNANIVYKQVTIPKTNKMIWKTTDQRNWVVSSLHSSHHKTWHKTNVESTEWYHIEPYNVIIADIPISTHLHSICSPQSVVFFSVFFCW